jgi:hypothetical protein
LVLEIVGGVFWAGFEVWDDDSGFFRDGDVAKDGGAGGESFDLLGNAEGLFEFAGQRGKVF